MEAVQKVPQVAIQIAVLEVVQGVLALLYEVIFPFHAHTYSTKFRIFNRHIG